MGLTAVKEQLNKDFFVLGDINETFNILKSIVLEIVVFLAFEDICIIDSLWNTD